jgi:hypothetical protein
LEGHKDRETELIKEVSSLSDALAVQAAASQNAQQALTSQQQLSATQDKQIGELEHRLQTNDNQLHRDRESSERRLAELRDHIQQLTNDISSRERNEQVMRRELEQMNDIKHAQEELHQQLQERRANEAKLNNQLAEGKRRERAMKTDMDAQQTKLTDVESKFAELSAQIDDAMRRETDAQEQTAELRRTINSLATVLRDGSSDDHDGDATIEGKEPVGLKAQLARLVNTLQKHRQAVAKLKSRVAELDSIATSSRRAQDELEVQLGRETGARARATAALEQYQQREEALARVLGVTLPTTSTSGPTNASMILNTSSSSSIAASPIPSSSAYRTPGASVSRRGGKRGSNEVHDYDDDNLDAPLDDTLISRAREVMSMLRNEQLERTRGRETAAETTRLQGIITKLHDQIDELVTQHKSVDRTLSQALSVPPPSKDRDGGDDHPAGGGVTMNGSIIDKAQRVVDRLHASDRRLDDAIHSRDRESDSTVKRLQDCERELHRVVLGHESWSAYFADRSGLHADTWSKVVEERREIEALLERESIQEWSLWSALQEVWRRVSGLQRDIDRHDDLPFQHLNIASPERYQPGGSGSYQTPARPGPYSLPSDPASSRKLFGSNGVATTLFDHPTSIPPVVGSPPRPQGASSSHRYPGSTSQSTSSLRVPGQRGGDVPSSERKGSGDRDLSPQSRESLRESHEGTARALKLQTDLNARRIGRSRLQDLLPSRLEAEAEAYTRFNAELAIDDIGNTPFFPLALHCPH